MKRYFDKLPKEIISSDDISYELFIPSLIHLFPFKKKMDLKTRLRFVFQVLRGEIIYYMKSSGDYVGYICLQIGGGLRYPGIRKTDLVISPFLVFQQYKGHGYGKRMLFDTKNLIAHVLVGEIYGQVHSDNIPSIKSFESANWIKVSNAKQVGLFKRYVMQEQGDYLVYKSR